MLQELLYCSDVVIFLYNDLTKLSWCKKTFDYVSFLYRDSNLTPESLLLVLYLRCTTNINVSILRRLFYNKIENISPPHKCYFYWSDISPWYFLLQEIYDKQKELILLGERVVLVTLGFDLNIHHAYKPLVEAIRRFNVGGTTNALPQVAWNFVNDGYANATLAVFCNCSSQLCICYTLKMLCTVQAANFALPAIRASSYCSRCYLFGC